MSGNTDPMPEYITNSIGLELRLIPAGEFRMGASDGDSEAAENELPYHCVEITKQFYMGVHEVTQVQFEVVMGVNPSKFKGMNRPVEKAEWRGAVEFCQRLSEREKE